jgi:Ala-tRNA(Pro) deacylase
MPISRTLKAYLDHERVHYDVLPHPEAFRAVAIAQTLHTPEKEIAKVVIVKVGARFVMTEEEIKGLFPDCELGAMPPFGNLYGLPVYVDQSLAEDKEIVFQAGTHSEAIRMRYWDFASLVFPVVEAFHRSSSAVW